MNYILTKRNKPSEEFYLYNEGVVALKTGDTDRAILLLSPLAFSGHKEAQYKLALAYVYKSIYEKKPEINRGRIVYWFMTFSNCDNDVCINDTLSYVGELFIDHNNIKEGLYWIQRAKNAGSRRAIQFLNKNRFLLYNQPH